MFGGLHPKPGLLDFVAMEVVSFGGEEYGSAEKSGHDLFPGLGANERDPCDVIGIFVEKAKLFPARGEVDAVHLGDVGQDAEWTLLALVDCELELRFKCSDVFFGHLVCDLEAECPTAGFL